MAIGNILNEQDARTNDLVSAIMQFYNDPNRQQEAQALPQAEADQAFNSLTGQYHQSSLNNAFDLASRGLTGGSQQQSRIGALNRSFQSQAANVEQTRQAQIAQNQMQLLANQNNALQQAFASNPFTQGAIAAEGQAQGINSAAAQNQAQQSTAMQNINSQYNAQLGQALGNPLNLWAYNVRNGEG